MKEMDDLKEAILLQWNRELLEQGLITEQQSRRAEVRIVEHYHKNSGGVTDYDKSRRTLSGKAEGKL